MAEYKITFKEEGDSFPRMQAKGTEAEKGPWALPQPLLSQFHARAHNCLDALPLATHETLTIGLTDDLISFFYT